MVEEQYRDLRQHYRIRDFFKPSILENILWGVELPVSFTTFLVTTGITDSPLRGVAYGLVPQALTYVAGRVTELTFRNPKTTLGKVARTIRNTKIPYS